MASAPQSHWLTASRLRVYPRIFLAVFVPMAAGWVLMSTDMVDPKGKPLGYDFITFWGASWLAPILGENTNIPLASVTLIALLVVAVRRALSAAPARDKIQTFAVAQRCFRRIAQWRRRFDFSRVRPA